MTNENKKKYEEKLNVNNGKRQIKVNKIIGEYNGNEYQQIGIEWYAVTKDGTPFNKSIKDEQGRTHFVPDVKKVSVPFDVMETLLKELK